MDEEGFWDACVEVVSEDADVDEPDVEEPDVDVSEFDEPDVDEPEVEEPDVDVSEPDIDEPDTDVDDVSEVSEEVPGDTLLSKEECSSDAEAGREEVLSD